MTNSEPVSLNTFRLYIIGTEKKLKHEVRLKFSCVVSQCEIEIFHDVEQRTLYLHLVTVHDGAMLCKLCEILNENIPPAVSIPMYAE